MVGSMNLAGYIWLIWVRFLCLLFSLRRATNIHFVQYGIVVYTSDDAPRFRNGNIGSLSESTMCLRTMISITER